jgi:hypothetical protein
MNARLNFFSVAAFSSHRGHWNRQMEHRCGLRQAAAIKVRLRTAGGVVAEAEICDISASGALLRCHLPVALHSRLSVQIQSGRVDRSKPDARLFGEVVRHVEGGFAVEWTEFSPQVMHLARAITLPRDAVPHPAVRRLPRS